MIPYSVLDLAPIVEGGSARDALRSTVDLAQHAERWGYHRYWMAEHHNMPGIASAATAVLIGQVAAATERMRVGSGGIMLPNHAPLVIAEQFGTLATLFPDRIDLGLGRAPGTDMPTARALRRGHTSSDTFPQDVVELLGYFDSEPANLRGRPVQAVPGVGTHVPVWILGSSLFGAQLAAKLGLPYAFASHFAPAALDQALAVYRQSFQPSQYLEMPRFMLAVNVFAADSDAAGLRLRTSVQQAFARLRSGRPGPLPPPIDNIEEAIDPIFLDGVERALSVSAVGAPATVQRQLGALIDRYRPDELILVSQTYEHSARLRCYEIAAEVLQSLPGARAQAAS
ncbi:LLM class flavin-dependent oxidoreductase [Haliangium ochraceum]|uniref:Luciferase-like monooxygenase n=1 Tax=Haliangium ochraceum (strain DSM 14365 / JCM 11303 / SMP-2) TaxID=502025 RepID=D0LI03_HALO1|nr:LLM class flavin-dependent oxidoreductase [Haliangium ochraceum]ACY14832.1 luciferase family oxidoreductase, group 1 [Haliangium ochraceum DSM 14365]